MINLIDEGTAIHSLRPGADWVIDSGVVVWRDSEQTEPTSDEIAAEVLRLQAIHDGNDYSRARKAKYDLLNQDEKIGRAHV